MMKRKLSVLVLVVFVVFMAACGASDVLTETEDSLNYPAIEKASQDVVRASKPLVDDVLLEVVNEGLPEFYVRPKHPVSRASFDYLTFEEALLEFATDVVIAQYIGHRPFGTNLTEFEFAVSERVLGEAAERIFVYADTSMGANVYGATREVDYRPVDLTFNFETSYLIPLIKVGQPHANTHDDAYTFIRNIVIDLDDISRSIMYSEPLSRHSEGLDFSRRQLSRTEIVSFVGELTRNNSPGRGFIRSEAIEDIVKESLYIMIVEVNEPLRLSHEQSTTDWMATDLYYVTATRILKGNLSINYEFVVIFLADTVKSGERYIVAIEPIEKGSSWYRFTSRNSLFKIGQLDEIVSILSE